MNHTAGFVMAIAIGLIAIFALTFAVGHEVTIAALSMIEFLVIVAALSFWVKFLLKRPLHPVIVVLPFAIVAFVSTTTVPQ